MNKKKYQFAQELVKELITIPYSKLSISNLCKSLHCSRQSFYYYFDTIDDCLVYFLKETFKMQIRADYLISDIFNFVNKNYNKTIDYFILIHKYKKISFVKENATIYAHY